MLLAAPRGFCAGVERAVDVVELALEHYGPPIYVRHAIVHNTRVVADLEHKGAVFVEDENDVPEGGRIVYSAHGIPPEVRDNAERRGLREIDATCPLVTKVHYEAKDFANKGHDIILVGHAGHQEVVGTTGHAPEAIHLVETPADVHALELDDPENVAYITQTTLSVDEANEVVDAILEKFPNARGPRGDDICYATTNRQDAVKVLAERSDVVLVIGSDTSSNSKRMVEVALGHGAAAAYLVDHAGDLRDEWFDGVSRVGLTSGASAPDVLVQEMIDALDERFGAEVRTVDVVDEQMHFALPKELRGLPLANA
ncbi:4-hydroxy-3-methylbut-2-enyl diphosphate reductase [Egibacter rhizosphaerae]|uniref:4-hydroxy-3-methylbut-2-enyl diphosphate reductase n=1 Tax=Egibacter rhizosphaerae TaxID=1670831 RepID=A0A411YLM3_9ACTN|nr:4-hydroxy-3-methylbut-2-enyl diphosphate reductase [Egibacter rhizosphaerae]